MKLTFVLKGGEGSGNAGRAGIPGHQGGSMPQGSGGGTTSTAGKSPTLAGFPSLEGWDYKNKEDSSWHEYNKVVDGIQISISMDTSLSKGDRVWNLTYTNLNSGLPNDVASKRYINSDQVADPGTSNLKWLANWAVEHFDEYKAKLTAKPKKTRRTREEINRANFVMYD